MQKLTILKKVRGVMTRFEPLTEEFISAQSEDGLTYSELSAVLSSYGLDIRKVVHDPTRQITPITQTTIKANMQLFFCSVNTSKILGRQSYAP